MAAKSVGRAQDALTRFGLGPRPGEISDIANDPNGFVLSQLDRKSAPLVAEKLPDTSAILTAQAEYQAERRDPSGSLDARSPALPTYRRDVLARARQAILTDDPFAERLVMFWSNFFAVAADKGMRVRATAGAFEREAIRPHVLGRFADMLDAATKHPAMLAYLDNDDSIGPNSVRGRRSGNGLNENLARETLELHSVGVDGGYDQADVTALAAILTGWKGPSARRRGVKASFVFDPSAHEPGAHAVRGKRYAARGVDQGEAVLADLARAPATARHVARRLAAHFVADQPPAELVARLEDTFRRSDGDLRQVAAALVSTEAAWTPPPTKFVPPYDLLVAAHRLTGVQPTTELLLAATSALAQPTWMPSSPKGWPDGDRDWAAPDALIERLDWMSRIAAMAAGTTDIVTLADDVLGSRLRTATRDAIARAESRPQALALLMASAEFQTR